MVEKYFFECLENLNLPIKTQNLIKRSTANGLNNVLSRIRDNFSNNSSNRKNSSYYNSEEDVSEEENQKNNIVSNKALVAKLAKERMEREKKKIEREEKARLKMQEEIEEFERKKLEEFMLREEEKRKRIEDLLYKKEQRRRQMDYLKELGDKEFRDVISSKPLYVKIEENFEEQVLMPELEKKKADLARKRELFQPLKKQDFQEHMKKYNENTFENQIRREMHKKNKQIEFKYNNSAGVIKSKFTENILEEEKKKKEEIEKAEQEKKILIEKKKKYASVVKEMFVPSIDEFKRQEMLLIQERLKHPVRIKISENKSISDEENRPKKKWKKNNLVPEKPPRREGKVIDYLAEKRKEKERGGSVEISSRNVNWEGVIYDENLDDKAKAQKLKQKALILEHEALKLERNIKSVSAKDNHSLKIANESDNLLLNSIRAKLAILGANS